ncbi:histidine kinase [Sphaerisporangium sp. NPDC005288]|uniref:sensor histidine kinase n=1 Tax=Sphaerisporangium sp. NPDC005288 TaxID=3155114 RepID=UPI0033A72408
MSRRQAPLARIGDSGVPSPRICQEPLPQDAVPGEAAARERARMALELHDPVAHSVSVMVMQAGGVRMTLRGTHPRASEALALVERIGRGAVEELQRMLRLLGAGEAPGLVPQPSLAGLEELAERARAGGLAVTVATEGEPVPLPAGLEVSAYRIVQEALTNAIKHAGPTRAVVVLAYRPGELSVEISDQGPPEGRPRPPDAAEASEGRGLAGVRERVGLFRGTLAAGPRPGGGFRVHAVLPLRPR